ncbi:MAG: Holliday junction resolvase RuvX [Calditrichia bacterium]
MGRLMGIDYGEKRIGVALSDISQFLSSPYTTIENKSKKYVLGEIKRIIQEKEVEELVVGLPVTLKGTDSVKTEEVRKWSEELRKHVSVPVILVDERLTTTQAHGLIHQRGEKVGKYRNKIDQMSASILLQMVLDQRKNVK